jgi:hypothetical protein
VPPVAVALCATALAGCAGLASLAERTHSVALTDTGETRLGKGAVPLTHDHSGQSALLRLVDGRDAFPKRCPPEWRAYQLRLGPAGSIQWIELVQGAEVVHDTEPGTTFWQRLGVGVLSVFPIESLL